MQNIIDFWAMANTLVIMFALGLHPNDSAKADKLSQLIFARVLMYNLLIPSLMLVALKSMNVFSSASLSAMALCIAAAGGTSAGAFVKQVKGSQRLIAQLIIFLLGVSLGAITVFSMIGWINSESLSLGYLAGYLLAITLIPLLLGSFISQLFSQWAKLWQPRLERVGGLLVILLVLALALRYGQEILTGPIEPLLAACVLVMIFVVPPLFERTLAVRRTVVLATLVRNLTLVLSLLAVLPNAANLLPTVLAFGLLMYVMVGVLLWCWQRNMD
ncbi:MAG: hypothetical protein Q7S87_08290 [Agitococcus sp.]|nr:hypothetical protein [Agitococcus sp.]